jgi:tricorn protease
MTRTITTGALTLALLASTASAETLLLADPAISADRIAFTYAGDIWTADRDGSNPRRLTSDPADERDPVFSPDGSMIAFSASYGGNGDVYVVDAEGGQPKRLTYHPTNDHVRGWAADGSAVAFASYRETNHGRSMQLYHIGTDGGLPEKQMEARYFQGSYDANGEKLAYIDYGPAYNGLFGGTSGWNGYRGGTAPSIRILTLDEEEVESIEGDRVSDIYPMWHGEDVLFLSDRGENERFNLYRYSDGEIEQLTEEDEWDAVAAAIHGATVIYEAGGRLKLFDLESGETTPLEITLRADLPQTQAGFKDASEAITSIGLSQTGKRALLTARGDVFTIPLDEGTTRNLTQEGGDRAYTAIWSPDGQRIAYVHDDGEKQRLVIRPQTYAGEAEPGSESGRSILSSILGGDTAAKTDEFDLGEGFHSLLAWTPDGKWIVFEDDELNLRLIDADNGNTRTLTTADRRASYGVSVSPDGRWLAATVEKLNHLQDLVLFDLSTNGRRSYTISDGMADAGSPAFSPDGKYLYFTASTNSGPGQVGLDLSSQERPYRAGIYVAVLSEEDMSPIAREKGDEPAPSDEEEPETEQEKKDALEEKTEDPKTDLNAEDLVDRIVALPVAEDAYAQLQVAANGDVLFLRQEQPGVSVQPPGTPYGGQNVLMRYAIEDKETSTVLEGVTGFDLSGDGKMLIAAKGDGEIITAKSDGSDQKPVDRSGLRVLIDPREEWRQIFNDVVRMEARYFYDPELHGLDWQAVADRYEPLLEHVGRREDLTSLLVKMIAEMQVGHNRTGGGDVYRSEGPGVGLLGADFSFEDGATRIEKIYTGELWNPFIEAPLAQPGLDVEEGDYILTVNGRPIGENGNIHMLLQGTAGQQVALGVADSPSGSNLRSVTVEPVSDEYAMRLWSWVEENRKRVDEETDGRVGYIYLPNTTTAGYTLFNRMFFPQAGKDALIIDERSNGGGQAANYVTDVLGRSYLSSWKDRQGAMFTTPGGAHYGPKVMLIDQDAGSGGDFLPYAFRTEELGTLMGTRTWGGLIGISANPSLIDGGYLTVPYFRFIDVDGEWSIENEGVAPDIEVKLDPVATNRGEDSQLNAAIEETLDMLDDYEPTVPEEAPAFPDELGQ